MDRKCWSLFRGGGIRRRLLMWGLSLFGSHCWLSLSPAIFIWKDRSGEKRPRCSRNSRLSPASKFALLFDARSTGFPIMPRLKSLSVGKQRATITAGSPGQKRQQLHSRFHHRFPGNGGREGIRQKSLFSLRSIRPESIAQVYQSTQGGGLYKPGLHFDPGPAVCHAGDPALGRRAERRRRGFGRSRSLISLGSDSERFASALRATPT